MADKMDEKFNVIDVVAATMYLEELGLSGLELNECTQRFIDTFDDKSDKANFNDHNDKRLEELL